MTIAHALSELDHLKCALGTEAKSRCAAGRCTSQVLELNARANSPRVKRADWTPCPSKAVSGAFDRGSLAQNRVFEKQTKRVRCVAQKKGVFRKTQ